ncbi:YIP1 family protein [Cognatishimia sp. SS12]|uniref:YIP1 family protein n=1 Tax=Cognatishimia sp. SS12 TaxID=2979465 RepID=UPI00232C96B2|nr:YIP1 family protein [Cognatishimia sp. SS12]MDC0737255.1 YIP1 family protein [Cognatishimia sp. SS12]
MLKSLFQTSIFEPQKAAEQILALRLGNGQAWQLAVIASILNAIMVVVTVMMFPPAVDGAFLVALNPVMLTAAFLVVIAATAGLLFSAGRFLKGIAEFTDVLTLLGWLQMMRVAVQVGGFVLMVFLPGLASVLTTIAYLYGFWILINFLKVAQGFDSLGRAASNLVLSILGMTVVLSLLLTFIGFNTVG